MNQIEKLRLTEELCRAQEHYELLTLALQQQPNIRLVRNLQDFCKKRNERWKVCQGCKREQRTIQTICGHCGGRRFKKAHSLKYDPREELAQRMTVLMDHLKAEES